jgi:hypothetical protein
MMWFDEGIDEWCWVPARISVVLSFARRSFLRSTDFFSAADWTAICLANQIGPPKPLTSPSSIDVFGEDFGCLCPLFGER